jgi:hypothetical protein
MTALHNRDTRRAARGAALGAILIIAAATSARAQEPPAKDCRSASKIEYTSAERQHLLRNRYGMYVRTGRALRRHYWYCHLG